MTPCFSPESLVLGAFHYRILPWQILYIWKINQHDLPQIHRLNILHLKITKAILVPSRVSPDYRQILIVWLRCHVRLHKKITLFGFPNCSRTQSGATMTPSALTWKGSDIFSSACSGAECDQMPMCLARAGIWKHVSSPARFTNLAVLEGLRIPQEAQS